MGPKPKLGKKSPASGRKSTSPKNSATAAAADKDLPSPAGYLISCDIPTKQFIVVMNNKKAIDKKFIIEDLDATHLLVKSNARNEIEEAVEKWMDDNVFSAIERVGENLDMS